jgi:hypothetical protein
MPEKWSGAWQRYLLIDVHPSTNALHWKGCCSVYFLPMLALPGHRHLPVRIAMHTC